LFPNIPLNDILEIEFLLGYSMHWQDLDHKDFYQVMWHYDRLMKQKNIEAHGADGQDLLSGGIDNLDNAIGAINGKQ
jgi:hypothetical protein